VPATTLVVVDAARILDESAAGKAAAAVLQARFDEARARHERLRERGSTPQGQKKADEAARAFEAAAVAEIEALRAQHRREVLAAAEPVIAAVAKARGASIVLERGAVLAVLDPAVDITDDVLARLGPA
jgi:Skp family chaperone for outer membrane proteins